MSHIHVPQDLVPVTTVPYIEIPDSPIARRLVDALVDAHQRHISEGEPAA